MLPKHGFYTAVAVPLILQNLVLLVGFRVLELGAPILMAELVSEFNLLATGIVRMKSVDLTVRFVATWLNAVI